MRHGAWVAAAALAAACAGNIQPAAPPPAPVPAPEPPEPAKPDLGVLAAHYEKLLELPQDPERRLETMRRLADLQLEIDEAGGSTVEESERRLERAIGLYRDVLAQRPDAPGNDRVLYQMARANQNLGDLEQAEQILQRLQRQYPASSYLGEAHFRRGELLFRLFRYEEAATEYRRVLDRGNATPFFEAAQYKYAWAQYRQSNYMEALRVFLTILGRELPEGKLTDAEAALANVAAGKKDMAQDALRIVSLSLAQLGGGDAAARYFATDGEPPFAALVYDALGELLLEKKRYTDTAINYKSFVDAHPRHELAPEFLSRAIRAHELGGFPQLVVEEKIRYVQHFDPAAEYWGGKAASPKVLADLRLHLEDLARYHQARAQAAGADRGPKVRADFDAAAKYYGRLLELFPKDPEAGELRFLMAESLLEAGQTLGAALEYDRAVAENVGHDRAAEAAYAALLAYQRYAGEVPEEQKADALRYSVQAGLQLAERFPRHPQALSALARSAEDLYALGEWDEAIGVARRVLEAGPGVPQALRRTAWSVTADAHFSRKRYPEAEAAYRELLALTAANAADRKPLGERLASAVYQQGESARAAGEPAAAAAAFLRVGRLVPGASIRATADYDAGAMLIAAKDWVQAAAVLEAFRKAYPASQLLPDVDKKLAVVYESAGNARQSAAVLRRIAARDSEPPETRREAAWLAVTRLDEARDPQAAAAYESYVQQYPAPFERAMEARQKLADFAGTLANAARRQHWLREIVAADAAAGEARTPRSRQLAARAVLEFGRIEAQKAAKVPLRLPLNASVPQKKQAMESALATLTRAIEYDFAEVTTAATFELGTLYEDFSRALLQSDRPKRLSALEKQQYDLLLEEQAFPFEEKAIEWHEANVQRVSQNVYNPWIGRSMQSLARLVPARYGKTEQVAPLYSPAAAGDSASLAEVLPLMESNQLASAEELLARIAIDTPGAAGLHINMGIVYARTGRKTEALSEFIQALAADAKNAVAYNWLAVLTREAGNYASAEEAYREALAADPAYAPAQFNLAILYDVYLKRPADALAAYRRYHEMTQRKDLRTVVWIGQLEDAAASPPPPPGKPVAAPVSAPGRSQPRTGEES